MRTKTKNIIKCLKQMHIGKPKKQHYIIKNNYLFAIKPSEPSEAVRVAIENNYKNKYARNI